MEAGGTPGPGFEAELDRIEAAVDAGDTDLRRLGFWRMVGLIKRDDDLIERYADRVGRIDGKAFRAGVRFRLPVWLGNALLVGQVAAGIAATWLAIAIQEGFWSGVLLVAAGGAWMVGLHSPTHWIVGRLVGIRSTDYFLGGPPPPRPGLKTDYATYLRASPAARAWMHAAGAIATKLAPFLALAFVPAAQAPGWAVAVLLGVGFFVIVTDVLFSTKTGDWKKVIRELGVARARRQVRPQVS